MAQAKRQGRKGRAAGSAACMLLEGIHPVREALRARRRTIHGLRLRSGRRGPEVEELRELAEAAAVPIREDEGQRGAAGGNDQGVQLEVGPLPEVPLESLVGLGEGCRTLVALDGVEDPQNVGAIARVADGVGAIGLVLTARRAPPLGPAISRASAGAIEWLPVARVGNLPRALGFLKREGYWAFGAELSGDTPLYEMPDRWLEGDRVVVLGSEGKGLRSGVSAQLDYRVKIPMLGATESLNVGAAGAVLLYELSRRSALMAKG